MGHHVVKSLCLQVMLLKTIEYEQLSEKQLAMESDLEYWMMFNLTLLKYNAIHVTENSTYYK